MHVHVHKLSTAKTQEYTRKTQTAKRTLLMGGVCLCAFIIYVLILSIRLVAINSSALGEIGRLGSITCTMAPSGALSLSQLH